MLLLDEPMAGLGPEETTRMTEMLRTFKRQLTMLLVEHDMRTVFTLADRITVLVYGRAIASGEPNAIRNNNDVRQAYLGEDDVETVLLLESSRPGARRPAFSESPFCCKI